MTWEEFREHTMPVAVQLGTEYDLPTWRAFHRTVKDVPLVLYLGALETVAKTRTKFPAASQVLQMAEARRLELMSAHPYERCSDCHGFGQIRVGTDLPPRYVRCRCWDRYQAKLTSLGIGTEPLALPPAQDFEQVSE
jgi:hypothetical protein